MKRYFCGASIGRALDTSVPALKCCDFSLFVFELVLSLSLCLVLPLLLSLFGYVVRRALSGDAVKAVERGADVRQAVLVKNALVKKTLLKVKTR